MTDRAFDPADVQFDDELVFGGEVPPPPPPRKAARASRRVPAEETSSVAVPEPATGEPAGPPAPIPQREEAPAGSEHAPRDRAPLLLAAAVGFALLTSLIALGASIAIGRTLSTVAADRDRAAANAAALERVPAIVRALDDATGRLDRASRSRVEAPATAAEVRAAIDGLRLALAERRPTGIAPVAGTLRDGFSEMDVRLARIEDRLDARPRRAAGDGPEPSRRDPRRAR